MKLNKEQREELRLYALRHDLVPSEKVIPLLDTCDELEREAAENKRVGDCHFDAFCEETTKVTELERHRDELAAEIENRKRTCPDASAIASINHMAACRALLNVPDDETLYVAIQALRAQVGEMTRAAQIKEERGEM